MIIFETILRTIEFGVKIYDAKCRRKDDNLIKRSDLILKQTCQMCPEQYDIYIKETEELVGYFRLRHGVFTVSYPDCGGELIYCEHPDGDGSFTKHERDTYLSQGLNAIVERLNNEV